MADLETMEIPEIKPWDPKEELINDVIRTLPSIVIAFIVGNLAAWIYWLCYVNLVKLIKWIISRRSKSVELETEMTGFNLKSPTVPTEIDPYATLRSVTNQESTETTEFNPRLSSTISTESSNGSLKILNYQE